MKGVKDNRLMFSVIILYFIKLTLGKKSVDMKKGEKTQQTS